MTQYEELVEKQRIKIEAEKWASGIKCIHSHSSDSMWYAPDRSDGSVLDIEYNDGSVMRTIKSTDEVVMLGKRLSGDELVSAYQRGGI